jgi:hypothetical protein
LEQVKYQTDSLKALKKVADLGKKPVELTALGETRLKSVR